MTTSQVLADEKKLTVVFRVEPGCLGPQGAGLIDDFCAFAKKSVASLDSDYVIWNIIPRNDKALSEVEYMVLGKKMNHAQAEQYLLLFKKDLNEFETHLNDRLAELIDEFLSR